MVDTTEGLLEPSLFPPRSSELVLPCISLWQPYATLIEVKAKPFETRHWPAPSRLIGQWVAIHAAARRPTRGEVEELNEDVQDALGFCHWPQRIPYGAVVCIAKLTGCYRVERWNGMRPVLSDGREIEDDGFGDYTTGRFCWELNPVRPLAAAVPAKGAQGWWNWTVPDDAVSHA